MTDMREILPVVSRLLQQSATQAQYLYMFVDAAQDSRIYPKIQNSINTRCCLFSEDHISDEIKSVSPYLMKIKIVDDFVEWCLREGLLRNWMILFSSTQVHVSELRLHFKRFSLAQTPDGKRYFFRYYDPRVLPPYLLASTHNERDEFFRECSAFWLPERAPGGQLQLRQINADGSQALLQNAAQPLVETKVAETRLTETRVAVA